MRLYEYEGKRLLAARGLAVPRSRLVESAAAAAEAAGALGGEVVVKAQVLQGGRGKRGLIRFAATPAAAAEAAAALLGAAPGGEPCRHVLVEERLAVARELYVGVAIDYARGRPVVLFSADGGVEVEATSREAGAGRQDLSPLDWEGNIAALVDTAGFAPALRDIVTQVARRAIDAFRELDAELVEINPLVVTRAGALVAADARVVVDDNALFRHPELAALRSADRYCRTELERLAYTQGVRWVDLDGDVAVLSVGAGSTMAVLDALVDGGLRPANFCDLSSGFTAEAMQRLTELFQRRLQAAPPLRGLLVNINLSATPVEHFVDGLRAGLKERLLIPASADVLVSDVAAQSMSRDAAADALRALGIEVAPDLPGAVAMLAARIA